jgi:hypothetical protein
MNERWFVETTTPNGQSSITYGPDREWAKTLTAGMLDSPGIVRVAVGVVTGSTLWLDSPKNTHGVEVKARQSDGWVQIDLKMDESIVGYAITLNGRSLPWSDSVSLAGGVEKETP